MPTLHQRSAQGQLELLYVALDASYKALKDYNPCSSPPPQPRSIDVAVVTIGHGMSWLEVVAPIRKEDLKGLEVVRGSFYSKISSRSSFCIADLENFDYDNLPTIFHKLALCLEYVCNKTTEFSSEERYAEFRRHWKGYVCVTVPIPGNNFGDDYIAKNILRFAPSDLKGSHLKLEVANNFKFGEKDFPLKHRLYPD